MFATGSDLDPVGFVLPVPLYNLMPVEFYMETGGLPRREIIVTDTHTHEHTAAGGGINSLAIVRLDSQNCHSVTIEITLAFTSD